MEENKDFEQNSPEEQDFGMNEDDSEEEYEEVDESEEEYEDASEDEENEDIEDYKTEDEYEETTSEDDEEDEDGFGIRVMIVTADNIITGVLQIAPEEGDEEYTQEEMLFITLNCGNQFVALRNCSIMDKDNTEFEPERVRFYLLNLDIVQSCRIVNTERRGYNRK